MPITLSLSLAIAPLHNEEVINHKIARYKVGIDFSYKILKDLYIGCECKLYGLTSWPPQDQFGADIFKPIYTSKIEYKVNPKVIVSYKHTNRLWFATPEGRYYGWMELKYVFK